MIVFEMFLGGLAAGGHFCKVISRIKISWGKMTVRPFYRQSPASATQTVIAGNPYPTDWTLLPEPLADLQERQAEQRSEMEQYLSETSFRVEVAYDSPL